jgi:type I protein arginine methyltransferase
MNCLLEEATAEKFKQPILDTLNPENIICEKPFRKLFNFETCTLEDLKQVELNFTHTMSKTSLLHGYCMYFDAHFDGKDNHFTLYTSPKHDPTHWYQTLLFFEEPVGVNRGQEISGSISLKANKEQAFDTEMRVKIPEINVSRMNSDFDMKDPEYRGCYKSYNEFYGGDG